jgi:hypothetical protein
LSAIYARRPKLDSFAMSFGIQVTKSGDGVELEHRVVDFHEVFTLPRPVLESLLRARGRVRPQLLPPYREHLSQAFARFFMRVGLPTPVMKTW